MNKWLNIIQSAVLPPVCLLCGDRGSQIHHFSNKTSHRYSLDLCNHFRDELPLHATACARCASNLARPPSNLPNLEALCGRCQTQPPDYDRSQAMLIYHSPANHLLRRLKLNGRLEMARVFGELMAKWLERIINSTPDSLIPMPLHKNRLNERCFNQAVELARPIATPQGLPMDIKSCIRIKTTTPQSDLSHKKRIKNVRGAFEVSKPVTGHVVIIDNVMTTGSTAHEFDKTLLQAGATSVDVWICARA